MATITSDMAKQAYIMAKKVYNNEIDRKRAIKKLHDDDHMNENSATIMIDNFRSFMNGQEYGRMMKADDTRYYLMEIRNDYGEDCFKKALYAVKQHIEYLKKINKPANVEQLYKELIKKYNVNEETYNTILIEENDIKDVRDQNDSRIEPAVNFTYERDLQDALINQAEKLFPGYTIFGENLEGREYQIEGKRIDLLMDNSLENELLAIELKAGIADYKVFGQISMYLGLLKKEFPKKNISGIIIAGKIDDSLKYAVTTNERIKIMEYRMELTINEIA